MDRRELLKVMVAAPVFMTRVNGIKQEYGANLDPNRETVIFVDKVVIKPEIVEEKLKGVFPKDPWVIGVDVPHGMTIDQVVRMFQGLEQKPAPKP